jgi:hypothetical protein
MRINGLPINGDFAWFCVFAAYAAGLVLGCLVILFWP